MIKVTILYSNGEDKTFDIDYYSKKHMPMVASLFGDALKAVAIDKGLASGTPDTPVPYLAVGYLYFDSISAFQSAFAAHADKITADLPNYTNIEPMVQISEVVE